MLNRLIIHTGLFNKAPSSVELLGSLKLTNEEMFQIGKNLTIPQYGVTEVFTNNAQLFKGIIENVYNGSLDHNKIFIFYHQSPERTHILWLDNKGHFNYQPAGLLN